MVEGDSPLDYFHQRHGEKNTFNSWNDYLGLSTLISKALVNSTSDGGSGREVGKSGLHHPGPAGLGLRLHPRGAPCIGRSLDLSDLGLCSHHHHGDLLGSDLEERFSELSPFSAVGYSGGELGPHLEERDHPTWNRVDLIMMEEGRSRGGRADLQICVFCRNNNESITLYTTHILKSPDGRVLCPILRRYTCPLCGANGDNAHTIKYCPLSKLQLQPNSFCSWPQPHVAIGPTILTLRLFGSDCREHLAQCKLGKLFLI
uniref:Nanos C2HC-type zinc finger 1 n=1 Tax=Callorhinchus milii TaxID=7868 RepID=A0A4W3K1E6_CALMI